MFKAIKNLARAMMSDDAMRDVYLSRRQGKPSEGNRTPVNLMVSSLLFVLLFGVLISTINQQSSPSEYIRERENISKLEGVEFQVSQVALPRASCPEPDRCLYQELDLPEAVRSGGEWPDTLIDPAPPTQLLHLQFQVSRSAAALHATKEHQSALGLPRLVFRRAWVYLDERFVEVAHDSEPLVVTGYASQGTGKVKIDVVIESDAAVVVSGGDLARYVLATNTKGWQQYQNFLASRRDRDSTRFGFIARHLMAFFILILFLFIDGSPETLGLGIFMGFEAIAKSFYYRWIPVESDFLQHYCYQMGDIFRLYFFLHLARMIDKGTWRWFFWGSLLSIAYGLSQEFGPFFEFNEARWIRSHRDLVIGLLGTAICFRGALFLRKQNLPWRVAALVIAGIAAFEQSIDMLTYYLPFLRDAVGIYGPLREIYRPAAYYLLATSAFINISTMENRIRSLSSARFKSELEKIRQEQKIYEAIAKTSQMMAHDVRKPFSMLKAAVQALRAARNETEMRSLSERLGPEIDRAIAHVDGMVADVMDIGGTKEPDREQVSLESMIQKSLAEVFRFGRNDRIRFQYRFDHTTDLNVDPLKAARVLLNVLENASEAVGERNGTIWFESSDLTGDGECRIRLTIGNSDSLIPEHLLEQIFNPFVTRGKRSGTGLGLAVARRLVELHGGEIKATSSKEKGTEFTMTFPAIGHKRPTDIEFPANAGSVVDSWSQHVEGFDQLAPQEVSSESDNTVEERVASICGREQRVLTVLFVDDESLYINALKDQLHSLSILRPWVSTLSAANFDSAILASEMHETDLVICDIDLGERAQDGFDIVRRLRELGSEAFICMHSNRSVPEDFKRAADAGADSFLLKPMSRSHLVRIIERCLQKSYGDKYESIAAKKSLTPSISEVIEPISKKADTQPKVVLVEDDIFFIEAWRAILGDKLVAYNSPEEFWAAYTSQADQLSGIEFYILDQYFDNSADTGLDIAERLHGINAPGAVLLATGAIEFTNENLPLGVHGVIGKEPRAFEELGALVVRNWSGKESA